MFPAGIKPEDVMPYQLRQIIQHQVQNLAAKVTGEEHIEARKAGTEAINKSRKVIQTSTKMLQTAKRAALRCAAAGGDELEER